MTNRRALVVDVSGILAIVVVMLLHQVFFPSNSSSLRLWLDRPRHYDCYTREFVVVESTRAVQLRWRTVGAAALAAL